MKRLIFLIAFPITLLLLASAALTAQASGQPQQPQFSTPTARPDGRIIYIVQENDSCIRISLLTGVPMDQLRALNRLDTDCALSIGQELLIGIGGPAPNAAATAGPEASPTPALPTPTTLPGAVDVCVTLFEDLNGDALRQETEVIIPDGAVSITGSSGQYSQTATTQAGLDPVCFTKVPIGSYNISVAAPQGYNPTSLLNYTLEIKAGDVKTGEIQPGDRVYVDFGAQKASLSPVTDPGAGKDEGDSGLLGIIGGILLLAGIGLAVYAWLAFGRRPKYM
jgi:hypothetical protein